MSSSTPETTSARKSPATGAAPSPRGGRILAAVVMAIIIGGILAVLVVTGSGEGEPAADGGDVAATSVDDRAGDVSVPGVAEVGTAAPAFEIPDIETEAPIRFDPGAPDAASVTIVNFWASWCFPCREEFPVLRETATREGVRIIGVLYEDNPADARSFAAEQDANWASGNDSTGRVAADYGVRAIPQTFVIDVGGTITTRHFGGISQDELDAAISDARG